MNDLFKHLHRLVPLFIISILNLFLKSRVATAMFLPSPSWRLSARVTHNAEDMRFPYIFLSVDPVGRHEPLTLESWTPTQKEAALIQFQGIIIFLYEQSRPHGVQKDRRRLRC